MRLAEIIARIQQVEHEYRILVEAENSGEELQIREDLQRMRLSEPTLISQISVRCTRACLDSDAPLLPIVVLSLYPDVRPAYEAGVNAFVHKATDLDDFFARCKIMQFWVDLAELPREQTHALLQSA
jgi:hypothetical protein